MRHKGVILRAGNGRVYRVHGAVAGLKPDKRSFLGTADRLYCPFGGGTVQDCLIRLTAGNYHVVSPCPMEQGQ